MSTEAMKLALEALTATMATHGFREHIEEAQDKAIKALEEALNHIPDATKMVKQEQGEYVAEVKRNSSGQIYIDWRDGESAIVNLVGARLYTTPQQRKPLELSQMVRLTYDIHEDKPATQQELYNLIRKVEAAHGIKE